MGVPDEVDKLFAEVESVMDGAADKELLRDLAVMLALSHELREWIDRAEKAGQLDNVTRAILLDKLDTNLMQIELMRGETDE